MHKLKTTYVSPETREIEAWFESSFLASGDRFTGSSTEDLNLIDDEGFGQSIWN